MSFANPKGEVFININGINNLLFNNQFILNKPAALINVHANVQANFSALPKIDYVEPSGSATGTKTLASKASNLTWIINNIQSQSVPKSTEEYNSALKSKV